MSIFFLILLKVEGGAKTLYCPPKPPRSYANADIAGDLFPVLPEQATNILTAQHVNISEM